LLTFVSDVENGIARPCQQRLFKGLLENCLDFTFRLSLMSVELIGPYWRSSDKTGGPNTLACGWPGLTIGRILQGKPAPYRIDDNEGAIGWAPASSLRYTGGVIVVQLSVIVPG
jgi:hypothetical protein